MTRPRKKKPKAVKAWCCVMHTGDLDVTMCQPIESAANFAGRRWPNLYKGYMPVMVTPITPQPRRRKR